MEARRSTYKYHFVGNISFISLAQSHVSTDCSFKNEIPRAICMGTHSFDLLSQLVADVRLRWSLWFLVTHHMNWQTTHEFFTNRIAHSILSAFRALMSVLRTTANRINRCPAGWSLGPPFFLFTFSRIYR